MPVARDDQNDYIFKTKEAKLDAVVEDIVERHEAGQPVLVGTIAVETSEYLSELLTRRGIPHNVLNAKEHEREAEIISRRRRAGRGHDRDEHGRPRRRHQARRRACVEVGGLYVLGTERHEARRIDNQLRGRSGRQGDPGETRFYLSAQDDLVRLFAGDRIHGIMERFKIPDDQPMEAAILSRQIESAQKKVEEQNFVSRKNVLKYDDVMNTQRMVIYEQRRQRAPGRRHVRGDPRAGSRRSSQRTSRSSREPRLSEEWDLDGLVDADAGALRHRHHDRRSCARRSTHDARR